MIIDYAKLYSKNEGWFSRNLATNLLNFLKERNYRVKSILDIACGTGDFVSVMRNGCPNVLGIDYEKAFVSVAKKQVQDAEFELAPLFEFDLKRTFDLVAANYETVNFALDNEHLNKFFANAAKHLEPNGIFMFDFKTPNADLVEKNITFTETTEYDWIKKYTSSGDKYSKHEVLYVATKENHKKIVNDEDRKVWSVEEIKKALEANGFYNINLIDSDFNVLKKPKKAQHIHVLCYKK